MIAGSTLRVAHLGVVDYDASLKLQTALAAARIADEIGDTLLLLEHGNVFTLGRGADERFIVAKPAEIPIYRVSRGGEVTYHGPGQLVGYPILKLDGRARDVSKYLRALEQTMIDALASFGVEATRREGLTGVWIGQRKIGSIGVGIKRWVTYHGFALNVSTDLRFFDSIVPCGIDGCEMTSLAKLGHPEVSIDAFSLAMRESFRRVFAYDSITVTSADEIWNSIDSGRELTEAQR